MQPYPYNNYLLTWSLITDDLLFHNDLLAQFSYVGQKGKKVFSVLNTCSILFGKQ